VFQIPLAVLRSMILLKRFGATMVVGVGGFASGPCVLAARLLGIRTGVLEQNSVAGFTNRLLAKLAHHVFTAFPDFPPGFPAKKCIYTGNPSRATLHVSEDHSSGPFTVFAFGGSQGATGINKLLTGAVKILRNRGVDFQVIHQTGERDYDWVAKEYAGLHGVEVHRFIDDMQRCYDRASVVLCRAGSGTISELGATKCPAVFVPFPAAAGNHQEINARAVERAGGARVILQQSASAEDLARALDELRSNPAQLAQMRERMGLFHKPDAAWKILNVMIGG
jgi:UDP-N-acetylglucosamine--N-acetylmuramyl-(pentapeptide) pyrophosphoryl-undecaprenol N-acetylglucosamine transferase